MPTDILVLGGFVFDDWSTPEKLPFGGRQQMHVHKMPGGSRVIDCMGPDDEDRAFSAKFWGADAIANALTLDRMRAQGQPLPYSNGVESRTVIIAEFHAKVVKVQYVEFDIVLVTADDSGTGAGGGIGSGTGLSGLDSLVGADLATAAGLLS